MFTFRKRGADGCLQVSRVVQRVENAQDIHPAIRCAADEDFDQVIGETRVLHDVLPSQQHPMRSFRCALFQRRDALERILSEIAETGIDRRPAPSFQLVKPECIEVGQRGEHLLGPHPRCGEGLVSIAEHRVGELDALH